MSAIDTGFDFREDARGGDPDWSSPTLRRFHQMLWSKQLRDGRELALHKTPQSSSKGFYLYAVVEGEAEQPWGSDSILATHTRWKKGGMDKIMAQVSEPVKDEFFALGYTIGGFMLWPQNKVDRKPSINQARGWTHRIADRMDLTLECVRRYYVNPAEGSPLAETFGRYPEFFELFQDFRGFVEFWLFQDLVSADYEEVNFFLPFNEFDLPTARSADEWDVYRLNSTAFCNARNQRIERWAFENLEA